MREAYTANLLLVEIRQIRMAFKGEQRTLVMDDGRKSAIYPPDVQPQRAAMGYRWSQPRDRCSHDFVLNREELFRAEIGDCSNYSAFPRHINTPPRLGFVLHGRRVRRLSRMNQWLLLWMPWRIFGLTSNIFIQLVLQIQILLRSSDRQQGEHAVISTLTNTCHQNLWYIDTR